jgi:hypothetical protein
MAEAIMVFLFLRKTGFFLSDYIAFSAKKATRFAKVLTAWERRSENQAAQWID